MEVLVGLLTGSNQLHQQQQQQQQQGMSLDDMAQMASSNLIQRTSSSFLAGREDSLVFMLGLLNLGTVLFYAVYANLFKQEINRWTGGGGGGGNIQDAGAEKEQLFKKIQSVLDELVLHVHTASYYHRREDRSNRQRSARTASTDGSFISQDDDDYRLYLNRQIKKMIRDWLAMTVANNIEGRRLTKRQAEAAVADGPINRRNSRHQSGGKFELFKTKSYRRSPFISGQFYQQQTNGEAGEKHQQQQQLMMNKRRQQLSVATATTTTTTASPASEADGHHYHQAHFRQLDFAGAAAGVARPDIIASRTAPAESSSVHVPVLPVRNNFKSSPPYADDDQEDDQEDFSSSYTVTSRPPLSSSYPQIPTRRQQMQMIKIQKEEEEEDGSHLVNRLMQLVTSNTPLTLEVLDVYRHHNVLHQGNTNKCLERLLCQLNQDWKSKGSVPAALAPFLSITMGWWLDDGRSPTATTASSSYSDNLLSHVLMAVRAGWIGKHCAVLYPRCANPQRVAWNIIRGQPTSSGGPPAVAHLEEDSVNSPSVMSQAVKVRPPVGFQFLNHLPPPPSSHSSSSSPFLQAANYVTAQPPPPQHQQPSTTSEQTTSTTTSTTVPTTMAQSSVAIKDSEELNDVTEETNNQDWQQTANDRIDTNLDPATSKPWGKPSRFSVTGDVPLSDIVRGIYPPTTEQDEAEMDEEDDDNGGGEIDDDEGDSQEEEMEEDEMEEEIDQIQNETTEKQANTKHNILHDLNRHHFGSGLASGDKTQVDEPSIDPYLELQKKKTERLALGNSPQRGLVHPWLAEPVWVPENPLGDNNLLSMPVAVNEYDDIRDRYRDRVPFVHEDAVKDSRLHDFAMQYLRDRSA